MVCGNDVVTWCFGHLLEQYDLFYLDTSFRSGKENRDELCSHLWKFTEDNLKRAQGGNGTEFTDERDRGQRLCQGHGRRWNGLLSAGGPGYEGADGLSLAEDWIWDEQFREELNESSEKFQKDCQAYEDSVVDYEDEEETLDGDAYSWMDCGNSLPWGR